MPEWRNMKYWHFLAGPINNGIVLTQCVCRAFLSKCWMPVLASCPTSPFPEHTVSLSATTHSSLPGPHLTAFCWDFLRQHAQPPRASVLSSVLPGLACPITSQPHTDPCPPQSWILTGLEPVFQSVEVTTDARPTTAGDLWQMREGLLRPTSSNQESSDVLKARTGTEYHTGIRTNYCSIKGTSRDAMTKKRCLVIWEVPRINDHFSTHSFIPHQCGGRGSSEMWKEQ